jgi:hypothetical protein
MEITCLDNINLGLDRSGTRCPVIGSLDHQNSLMSKRGRGEKDKNGHYCNARTSAYGIC